MKSSIKYILGFCLALLFAFGIYNIASIYNLKVLKNNIEYSVISKNAENAISMTIDDNNNIYVSKNSSVKIVTPEGKEKQIFSGEEYNIEDILYDQNKIYFISNDKIEFYDLENNDIVIAKENIPLSGNDVRRRLFKIKDDIYITIGSITNSGIPEDANYDIPSFDVVLNGNNFGKNQNVSYCKIPGDKCKAGEKIKAKKIGNAAIYKIDKKTKEFELFANGIRSVTGIDSDSEGNVYAIFQGMSNKGTRPVNCDCDYIYNIKKGKFYGFPDYSGGDYIESPRFQDESNNLVKPILLNVPDTFDKEAAPIFISLDQGRLKSLAIDKEGSLFPKDSILFFDGAEKEIQVVNNKGKISKAIKTSDKSNIADIIYHNKNIYMIDSSLGYIYKLTKKTTDNEFGIPLKIWIYITIFSLILFVLIIVKYVRRKK